MAERKPAKQSARKSAKSAVTNKTSKGFTEDERAAMRERVKEQKAAARSGAESNEESAVLEKIAAMAAPDRAMAERLHAIVKAKAPSLTSRLWYGMPAYAKDGSVVCFFQPARKFKTRYATLGFSDKAHLDEGAMWPNAYALNELTDAEEARISALVQRAIG